MGKDKYSDDHTIEIVGGTNTLDLIGNLNISGEVNVSSIQTDTSIEVNAVNPGGEINIVAQDNINIEAMGVSIGGQALTFERIPTVISPGSAVERYRSYPAVAFIPNYTASSYRIEDPPYLEVRSTSSVKVWTPITDIPDGSVITAVGLTYFRTNTPDQFSSVGILKMDRTTGSLVTTSIGGVFNIVGSVEYAEAALPIGVSIDYEDYYYLLQLIIKDDVAGNTRLYGARITYTSNSAGK